MAASLSVAAQDSVGSNETPVKELPIPEDTDRKGLKNKLQNLGIGKGIKKTRDNVAISIALQQGRLAEFQERYLNAIHHYQKAIDLYVTQGDQQSVTQYAQHIALLYQKAGRTKQALDQYEQVLDRKELLGDTTGLSEIRENLITIQPLSAPQNEEIGLIPKDDEIPVVPLEDVSEESERLRTLAESTENNQDYRSSLEYFKLYTELSNQQKGEEQAQQLALQEKTFQIERQAQRVGLLESEKEIQELTLAQQEEQMVKDQTFKQNLLIGILLLALTVLATFFLYRGKRKALGDLGQAYNDLNHTKDQLVVAEEQLKNLLDQQVSSGVAQQLMDSGKADMAQKKFVCVMFLDIRGFTPFAEKLEPEELIQYQNDVFGLMIDIIDKNYGVINQFLGDGFMATFGLQENQSNVCDNALEAAMRIISVVNEKSASNVIPNTRVGIGLHAGNVVAGNVGTAIRKQYSITGNTVITASRIEQLNKRFESQLLISKEVYNQLSHPEKLPQEFINVEVKGRKQQVELLKIA